MTRGEMLKINFRPYMLIDYKPERSERVYEMLLAGIDFDKEVMTLSPMQINYYENQDYVVSISTCSIAKRKMRVADEKPPDFSKWPMAIKKDFLESQAEDEIDPAS